MRARVVRGEQRLDRRIGPVSTSVVQRARAAELEEVPVHLLVQRLQALEQRIARLRLGDELLDAERGEVAIARAPQRRDLIDATLDRGAMRLAVLRDELRFRIGDRRFVDRSICGVASGRDRFRAGGSLELR